MDPRIRWLVRRLEHIPTAWWVMFLTLPALVPLGRAGLFQSDDGLLHVYRLAALDRAVRAGVLYPRWFPEFAFGYGHPVLNFYGPLSYYWGLPLTLLGAEAALAMKLVLAGGLVASALGMYRFSRAYLAAGPALVAAVVYAYMPYHLVDLYIRGALAEFLAFVWFPLVLWSFQRLVEAPDLKMSTMVVAALLLAALLLTHGLSTLIFAPVLAIYIGFLLLRRRDYRLAGRVALVLLLSLSLTVFYWLPVVVESKHVGLGHGTSQGYRDHLLPLTELFSPNLAYDYGSKPGSPVTFPLGLVQALILVAAFLLLFGEHRLRGPVLLFLAVALVTAFMLTSTSLPVWQTFEAGLALLQYPWRFQAPTALATAFIGGALVQRLDGRSGAVQLALGASILLATGAWALWRLPVTQFVPNLSIEEMWQLERETGQVGTTWTAEYLPVWVQEQRWALGRSPEEPTVSEERLPPGEVRLAGMGYTRFDLEVDAPQGTTLLLHQFHYPGWQARWQGEIVPSEPRGTLGLAAFNLPPGSGRLTVRLAPTAAQSWGTGISLAVLVAMGLALAARLGGSAGPPAQTRLLAACCLVPAIVLVASLILPNGHVRAAEPVQANLQDLVELLSFSSDRTTYRPGDTIQATLYWRALRSLDQDYKTSVYLSGTDASYQPIQQDNDPGGGYSPTTRWLPGELVSDTHYLALPSRLAPGRYPLWAAMYEYSTVRNLAVISSGTPTEGNRILLGQIEVVSP